MLFRRAKVSQKEGTEAESASFKKGSGINIPLLTISLVGLLVAVLSGFHESIPFAGSLCSNACSDASRMHFLHVHFWIWGALFYLAVALLSVLRPGRVAWVAFASAGVEAVLVLLMVRMRMPCLFCIANAGIMVVLLGVAFRKDLFWQQAALALLFFVGFLFWTPYENNLPFFAQANSSVSGGNDSGAAASVDGELITNQRLDVLLGSRLQQMRMDIYRMKMQRLDELIVDAVLEREAKRQGKSMQELITGLTSSVHVSDADIDKYMQEHQQQLKLYMKTVPDLKQRLNQGLEEQKKEQAVNGYAHAHESRYKVRVYLSEPRPPVVTIDPGHAPAIGPKNAPVTVVEFSDYQCPACRASHPIEKQIRAAFGDKIRWVYKEFPLKVHQFAFKAAEAGLCAMDQGKFWQYQDQLYTTPDLSVPNMIAMAGKMGMSAKEFSNCMNTSKYKAMVKKSISEAQQAGIDRTPTYVVNGAVIVGGPSLDRFKKIIDEALRAKGIRTQAAANPK